jgi:hypothetical protein
MVVYQKMHMYEVLSAFDVLVVSVLCLDAYTIRLVRFPLQTS